MAINFSIIKNLTTDTSHNIAPLYVQSPLICQEPKSELYQYYIDPVEPMAYDKGDKLVYADYDSYIWQPLQRHLTVKAVAKIGIKNFPQIGAIGFYKDKYSSLSTILAPVHLQNKEFKPPVLAITTPGTQMGVTLTPPEDITYTCYKIIMRSGYYANEYVVYELSATVPFPIVKGDYDIYAIGYNENTGICSSPSNVVTYTQTLGQNTWAPENHIGNLYGVIIENVVVSAWDEDTTYTGYSYRASVSVPGVVASMLPQVTFGLVESDSGNYAGIAECYAGGVYIYGKVNTAITIPSIICRKAV